MPLKYTTTSDGIVQISFTLGAWISDMIEWEILARPVVDRFRQALEGGPEVILETTSQQALYTGQIEAGPAADGQLQVIGSFSDDWGSLVDILEEAAEITDRPEIAASAVFKTKANALLPRTGHNRLGFTHAFGLRAPSVSAMLELIDVQYRKMLEANEDAWQSFMESLLQGEE